MSSMVLVPLVAVVALVAGCAAEPDVRGEDAASVEIPHPLADEGYAKRRSRLLTTPARSIARDSAHRGAVVTLVIEYRMENEDALTAGMMADGSVSVYVESGGGVVGGGERPYVRAESMRLLRATGKYLDLFSPDVRRDLPEDGVVQFYVRTRDDRLLYLAVPREELRSKHHPTAELYAGVQKLMTMMSIVNVD